MFSQKRKYSFEAEAVLSSDREAEEEEGEDEAGVEDEEGADDSDDDDDEDEDDGSGKKRRVKRKAILGNRWTNKVVPYYYTSGTFSECVSLVHFLPCSGLQMTTARQFQTPSLREQRA